MSDNIENLKNMSIVFKNLPQNVYGFICELEMKANLIVINETLELYQIELVVCALAFFCNKISMISKKNFHDPNFEPILLAKKEMKKNCMQNFLEG